MARCLLSPRAAGGWPVVQLYLPGDPGTRKKFEVATTEGATPIKQDEKKGVPREFKKGDIFFNYGCFLRTWRTWPRVEGHGYPGDNDLYVCEIGLRQVQTKRSGRSVRVIGDDETTRRTEDVAGVEINH